MIPNPIKGNGEQGKLLNSLKPVVKIVAVVAAREAGVYLYKLALNKIHTEWIKDEGEGQAERHPQGLRDEAGARSTGHLRYPWRRYPERGRPGRTQSRRSRAAQRRVRDETGRFIRKDPPQEGGDDS